VATLSTNIAAGLYKWTPPDPQRQRRLVSTLELLEPIKWKLGFKPLLSNATCARYIAANIVAPANAFVNLAPNKLSFKAGGIVTAVLGTVIMPWKLMADASGYIFVWLIGYSALLGRVAPSHFADSSWWQPVFSM
jgi:hypothetical protein